MVLTKEMCDGIVERSEAFYKNTKIINGVEVIQYCYRYASYKDFEAENAFELRGITFVADSKGNYQRYLVLHKFFNAEQGDAPIEYSINELKNRTDFISAQDKRDGSMIRFIKVGDELIAKTKMDFFNAQTKIAEEIMGTDDVLKQWLHNIDGKYAAIFEVTSPNNRIVLEYAKDELVLLQLRDENSGEYLNIYDEKIVPAPIRKTEFTALSLDEIFELTKTETGIEGWVLNFGNFKVKAKTEWYKKLHGLMANDLYHEHRIIELTLTEDIDDIFTQVPDTLLKDYALAVSTHTAKVVNHIIKTVQDTYATNKIEGDLKVQKKEMASRMQGNEHFGLIMSNFGKSDDALIKATRDSVLSDTNRLLKAQEWLKKTGFTMKKVEVDFDA